MMATNGYDCEFVDTTCISEDVEIECSICLLILRQPYMVRCCGNRFCRTCLERLQEGALKDTPCPLCKQKIAAAMPDRKLQRLLNEKQVYCSNKNRGCTWTGELGQLEVSHLNESPSPDKLMDGCLYVQVLCSQCRRVEIERRTMTSYSHAK